MSVRILTLKTRHRGSARALEGLGTRLVCDGPRATVADVLVSLHRFTSNNLVHSLYKWGV